LTERECLEEERKCWTLEGIWHWRKRKAFWGAAGRELPH